MRSPNLSHYQPVCVRCLSNYTCKRNEILVRLSQNRIVAGDLWECPGCGHQLATGFALDYADRYGRPHLFDVWDKGLAGLGPNVVIGAPYKGEVYAEASEP